MLASRQLCRAGCLGRRAARRHCSSLAVTHLDTWLRDNAASFAPPVMNKLLHRDQLSVMFVGGPNRREDFHLEEGSEFFFQLRGDMELPTLQAGRRELVRIHEGEGYLLPSRIPHSPQRPDAGSIGLVVERRRSERELDGLRFYTDFEACDAVLWEQYFHCSDLGKDLAPVLAAFRESEEAATRRPSATSVLASPPLKQDVATVVPPPFRRLAASGMRCGLLRRRESARRVAVGWTSGWKSGPRCSTRARPCPSSARATPTRSSASLSPEGRWSTTPRGGTRRGCCSCAARRG